MVNMDIVFRLRGPHVNPLRCHDIAEIERLQALCREAADEIERLRALGKEIVRNDRAV